MTPQHKKKPYIHRHVLSLSFPFSLLKKTTTKQLTKQFFVEQIRMKKKHSEKQSNLIEKDRKRKRKKKENTDSVTLFSLAFFQRT